ncbi:MAG: SigB/SigF/SigG family RNA polymerase sigma factor [Ezakiella sp.]|uniref:SigB/SigF/SigG family RNA polymerase sigma factor n=1 Tax=Ezakiella sp. TaxID=1935205 RepID=UPI002A910661|nr:SigB/SigF/SigG family RNA polymerase sigma factor [Ezakiella sp.]MDY6079879.1 SigB/SigF/SigG family RNA polymerase sigma factor [Ezakiella sp.]
MAEEKKTDKKNKIDVDKSETIKQNEKKSSKKTSEKNEDVKDTTLSESSDEKIDKKNEKKRKKQEEIKEKFIEYQKTKDKALRDELIEEHMYLAEILAKKYTGRGIDYEDIFQVASVGLILAVDRFDPSKGYVFSSYATPTIIGEIKRHFRDKGWTIKVPRRIQELSKKISVAKNVLAGELGRIPTAEDIADYLDVSYDQVIEAMEASKVYQPGSIDSTIDSSDDGNDLQISDIIGDDDPTYERVENLDYLVRELKKLPKIERTILIERYINRKTQIAIAEELGISQMTVSRIEKKVIRSLRADAEKRMGIDHKKESKKS